MGLGVDHRMVSCDRLPDTRARQLTISALPGRLAVCRFEPTAPVPTWAASGLLTSVTRTPEEVSVVCAEAAVPDGVKCETGWRCLCIRGPLVFSEIGVISSLAAVLANLFDFAIAAGVVAIVLALLGVGASVYLLYLPVYLFLLLTLTSGLGMFLACANLFFRDVKYLVEVILTYGVFFTPVFYSASTLGKWGPILLLNPMGPILEGLRDTVILHHPPDLRWLAYSAVWAIGGVLIAWKVFHGAESSFAESI